jgi:two-component system, response regulator
MDDILLVEDNVQEAEIALESLKVYGLANRTHVAGDGADALDYLFSRRSSAKRCAGEPTLILLDLTLPMLSGLEVLRVIKGDPRSQKIPVIVLTSKSSGVDIHAAMKLSADGFIEKPVTSRQLLQIARRFGISLSREEHVFPAGDRLAR